MTEDTLVALCTAQGRGALSVLRLSGPKALLIGRSLAGFLPEKPESHRAYFGVLKHKERALDEVLVTYFREGQSFTGEETLEISCHGGGVYKDILKALIEEGARPAKKGEFSLQALSNGKRDLTQIEALLPFIESESQASRSEAFKQLRGELSKRLLKIEERWLFLLSHIEADIDFSLENLNTLTDQQIREELQALLKELESLIENYQPFDKLQKGLAFGIFGLSNAGKSSLFNALLEEDRAIVSKEEGTTRDIVEASLSNPKGMNILLKDCAGFGESKSEGEKKGQRKSLELFKDCDYRLILIDVSRLEPSFFEEKESLSPLKKNPLHQILEKDFASLFKGLSLNQKTWLLFTKSDLLSSSHFKSDVFESKALEKLKPSYSIEKIFLVSSLTKEGLSDLKKQMMDCGKNNQESFLITNSRHYEALKIMRDSLAKCQAQCQNQHQQTQHQKTKKEKEQEALDLDIMALNLQEGLVALYEILGKQLDDKVLDQVFEKFCIGK